MDLVRLKDTAIEAALAAGKIIRLYINTDIVVNKKSDASSYAAQVVTEIDLKCEQIIRDHLRRSCETHALAILSEETIDDGGRFEKDYFWCVDPLDGTLAFINKEPGFSVSIALVDRDGTPQLGIVYDPSRDFIYYAIKGLGAFKNDRPWKIERRNNHLTYVTDKKLSDTPKAQEIEALLHQRVKNLSLDGIKELSGGGSVINGIRVLENGPACMIKPPKKEKGGGSLWDFAAIACIFYELGLPATNYTGGKLNLNKKEGCFMNLGGVFFENLIE